MRAFLLVALLFVSSVLALSETEYKESFLAWMREHNKAYVTSEFAHRYTTFKKNLDYVTEWNSKGSKTVLGSTQFADLTNEEYRKIYLGIRFDGSRPVSANFAPVEPSNETLPASVDWVTKGAVTAIKNQGDCGSCWSFSTTGSVEGIHFLSTKSLVSLSEQNLMDCSTSYGNNGCNGGLMDYAFEYIIANKGIDTEASYPYTMKSEGCMYNVSNSGATISSYTDITQYSETDLQAASVKQPISVAIDASHISFQLYKSGVYNEPQCSQTALDHGVLVVGYGTDASTNTPYWLVKNSWGTSWGQAGYIWMSRNDNNQCGIATMASYPTV